MALPFVAAANIASRVYGVYRTYRSVKDAVGGVKETENTSASSVISSDTRKMTPFNNVSGATSSVPENVSVAASSALQSAGAALSSAVSVAGRPSYEPVSGSNSSSSSVPIAVPQYSVKSSDSLISVLKASTEQNRKSLLLIARAIVELTDVVSASSSGSSNARPSGSESYAPATASAPVSVGPSLSFNPNNAPYVDNSVTDIRDNPDGTISFSFTPSTDTRERPAELVNRLVDGENISDSSAPPAIKALVSNAYPSMGIVPFSQWSAGLKDVAYNPTKMSWAESRIIERYVNGEISASTAASLVYTNRVEGLSPLEKVTYTSFPNPSNPATTTMTRTVTPINPTIPSITKSVSSSAASAFTAAQKTVAVSSGSVDLSGVVASIQELANRLPDKAKSDALIEAKQEALTFSKTAVPLNLIDGAPASSLSPRQASFLASANSSVKDSEINNERFDDDDFDFSDLLMPILPFSGISSDVDAISGKFGAFADYGNVQNTYGSLSSENAVV